MEIYPCRRTGLGLDMIDPWGVIPPILRVSTMSIGATHKLMLKNHGVKCTVNVSEVFNCSRVWIICTIELNLYASNY